MGRYTSGSIDHKFWFAVQNSDAADRFGVTGVQPEELYYYFDEDSLPEIKQELKNIEDKLGNNLALINKFFEENTSYTYTDEKLAEYLNVDEKEAKILLSEYADYDLGLKIAEAVRTTGQCEFTAEL